MQPYGLLVELINLERYLRSLSIIKFYSVVLLLFLLCALLAIIGLSVGLPLMVMLATPVYGVYHPSLLRVAWLEFAKGVFPVSPII